MDIEMENDIEAEAGKLYPDPARKLRNSKYLDHGIFAAHNRGVFRMGAKYGYSLAESRIIENSKNVMGLIEAETNKRYSPEGYSFRTAQEVKFKAAAFKEGAEYGHALLLSQLNEAVLILKEAQQSLKSYKQHWESAAKYGPSEHQDIFSRCKDSVSDQLKKIKSFITTHS